jgi:hypothetical protein
MGISEKFIKVLGDFINIVGNKVKWWAVDGSMALALQGVDLEPGDIDILTDREGAYKIQELLTKYAIRPVSYGETNKYRSHFGIFSIDGVKIDVMGDMSTYRNGRWCEIHDPLNIKISQIVLGSNTIPVVSLDTLKKQGYLLERLMRDLGIEDKRREED